MPVLLLRHSRVAFSFFILGVLVGAQPCRAQSIETRIRPLLDAYKGKTAVAVKHLPTGEAWQWHADVPMPTASLIKAAVMIEAYRQADAKTLDLTQMLTVKEDDKVPGSGILTTHFSAGAKISLRDAIRLMIAYSDNTATNLVLDQIGLGSTAVAMEELGFPNTKIHAKVFRGDTSIFPERSKEFGLGSTTAGEMLALLERLQKGELASADSTKDMLAHLRACESKATFPRFLPAGTKVPHKTGSVNAVRTAAGIIEAPAGPTIVVVLTAENEDQRWTDENAGEILCGKIAREVYDHFNPPAQETGSEKTKDLAVGASGWLVEALQRTLNSRMTPSPALSTDGEFGNVTREAVVSFQKSQQLPETGIVDAAVWKALGPLVSEEVPVTDPAQLDLTLPAKEAADSTDGPPLVTCKAWAIGDPATGELIAGNKADQELEMASTTKLMTAWIVLKLAKAEPSVLEEIVETTAHAARTPGSSANLRSGEKLAVRELLFGLLLPSGNDAAVAFAEHFGPRFAPADDRPESSTPEARFVAEMNRAAEGLGLSKTQFQNPHGLPAEGHHTTARDLFRLAAAMVQDGSILPYVETRKHAGRLEGAEGYVRFELWQNTNRLLDREGYSGLKTGTTTPAGACLVSLGEHGDRQRIVVVLGSTSSDARYVDTRNLFRWAWTQP